MQTETGAGPLRGRVLVLAAIAAIFVAFTAVGEAGAQQQEGVAGHPPAAQQQDGAADRPPVADDEQEGGTARGLALQIRQTGYGTTYGKNKVAYSDFDFWVYRAPHFDIYYYQEEEAFLDEVVAFSETAYQRLSRLLAHDLSQRTPIVYYKTHQEFQQTHIYPYFLPEGVAAFAEPVTNSLVLPVDDPPDELLKLLTHEITHIFEYDFFYGGEVGRALRISPPGWVMEGLAEHVSGNLTTLDEMLLRDVVLADEIPSLLQMTFNRGFFVDYVLGQVVWDYIAQEYGEDGVRIFMAEIRRDLGQDIDRDLERAFNITPGEFNEEFRAYLRSRYLPSVLEQDEADDFGINVFADTPIVERPAAFSPAVSPEGDEFVAIGVDMKELKLDIMRFDMTTGAVLRNLTSGVNGQYEYIVAQGLTVGYQSGADISWSRNGTQVAFFGRTPPTRTLFVVDSETGRLIYKKKLDDLDQALSPNIGPDGRVAFAAHLNGVRDIWIYDPNTPAGENDLLNVTQDEVYDYAPVWSPDGRQIVFTSHVLGYKKLFMIDLARPQQRVQLTYGLSNDTQPAFSRDGSRLFFASDRTGKYNLYSVAMATGEIERYTNILHGVFFPQPLPQNVSARGDLLFSNFSDGTYSVYLMDVPEAPLETYVAEEEALSDEAVAQIEQEMADAASVQLDQTNVTRNPGGGWHISNIQVNGGYGRFGGNGFVLAATAVEVSDLLGNHRIVGVFGSVSSQRNLQGFYFNQKNRLNWGFSGTSQRLFFFTRDLNTTDLDREAFYELDGIELFASYPFSRDYRVEMSVGYWDQLYTFESGFLTTSGEFLVGQRFPAGTYLPLGVSLIADKARFREFGPFDGWRTRVDVRYAPPSVADLTFRETVIDHRMYFNFTPRNVIAWRTWAAWSTGEDPNVFFMGGLNQLRGYDYLQFSGNRVWFTNLEYRWPFIDEVRGGEFVISDIRGLFFFDMGAAWFKDQDFRFLAEEGDRLGCRLLREGAAELADSPATAAAATTCGSFGAGVMLDIGPLPLNFYLSQRTDGRQLVGTPRFDFYIGPRF